MDAGVYALEKRVGICKNIHYTRLLRYTIFTWISQEELSTPIYSTPHLLHYHLKFGYIVLCYYGLWPLLLTWVNLNPSMDK